MKSEKLSLGQVEELVNKIGGQKSVEDILRGNREVKLILPRMDEGSLEIPETKGNPDLISWGKSESLHFSPKWQYTGKGKVENILGLKDADISTVPVRLSHWRMKCSEKAFDLLDEVAVFEDVNRFACYCTYLCDYFYEEMIRERDPGNVYFAAPNAFFVRGVRGYREDRVFVIMISTIKGRAWVSQRRDFELPERTRIFSAA